MPKLYPIALVPLLLYSTLTENRAADFYVSSQGTASGTGTQEAPFTSLEQARDAVRALRQQKPDEAATVWIAGGTYILSQPFVLTENDSGTTTAPVTYRSVDGQTVRLINARRLSASDFQPVTDPATLARITDDAKGKIVSLDLKALGVRHNQPPPDLFTDSGGLPDLYIDGKRQPLARFPYDDDMTMKTVLVNGDPNKGPGVFEYREENYPQFETWAKELDRGVWLKGYWRVVWENESIRVKAIDTTAHTVTFTKGVPSGIGNKYHRPQGDGKEKYWLQNLLEVLDHPSEWCIDYTDQKIYLYPPGPLDKAEIFLGDSDEATIELKNASHIILRGLTVEYGLKDGISIEGGDGDLVAGCVIRNVDKYAVRVEGGTHHTVLSCDLYHLGAGGVWLSGGDETSNPRVPAGHQVINNHIHHFAEIEKVYAPGVNCGYSGAGGGGHQTAVGMLIAHNLIHDTPHGGVLYSCWDNVMEYNEVFRYCLVSNDLGAFYSYDRFDRMGNDTIRYNLIHSSANGDGIYFDEDHRDMHVLGNIICLHTAEKSSRGTGMLYKIGLQIDPKFDQDPASIQPLDCTNNITIQCKTGFSFFVPSQPPSIIDNNVAVSCETPWQWTSIADGKTQKSANPLTTGHNVAYENDPGFVDIAHLDFHLKPDSQLLHDLPGFKPIPVDKIGLYLDEYRKTLPTNEEIDRFSEHTSTGGSSYKVEDRN
jgi:hypothetical protein